MNLDLEVYHCVNILPFHFVFTSIMVHNGLALTFNAAGQGILHCTASVLSEAREAVTADHENLYKTICTSPFPV